MVQAQVSSPETGTASFQSILFPDRENWASVETLGQPAFFADLNLDQIVESIVAGRDEYNLRPFFCAPLKNLQAIAYRQDIFRDLEGAEVNRCVCSFAKQMQAMRGYLAQADKMHYERQKQRWFLDAVNIYCEATARLAIELPQTQPRSFGFQSLGEYLGTYTQSDDFLSLAAETQKLKSDLSQISYCLHVEGKRITVSRYEAQPDYGADVLNTFEKFKQGTPKRHRFEFPSHPDMNHVEAAVLDLVASLYPETFSHLDEYCKQRAGYLDEAVRRFDREVQFYVAYLDYLDKAKAAGLQFCYPDVSRDKQVCGRGVFDLALAGKLVPEHRAVITNDFFLNDPERIIVVSGPNQGGKTTFARMFGQLHYLANLGCCVPGMDSKLFLFDNLFTHFEREENTQNLSGKLEDELLRIHQILEKATSNSILILNESFLSTTLDDAVFLSKQVMERIIELGMLCISVTFLDEMAALDTTTVSMVSTVNSLDPALRTFKIIRRPADGLAYAEVLAQKYGLRYEDLLQRISENSAGRDAQ